MRRLLFALLLVSPSLFAAELDIDATFRRGNEAYLHGDYKAATDAYEQVLNAGVVHQDLEYNLANAYFRLDRVGPAILHYERALQLDPSQEDAEFNLRLARDTAASRWQDRLQGADKDPLWIRVLAPFTLGGLGLLFLGLYGALFLLALAVYLLPRGGSLRVVAAALLAFNLLGAGGAGTLLFGRWWLENRVEQGIALPDELAVKEGPDGNDQTAFLIHAGLRLRVTGHEQDWVRIRLANGLEGWVRDRDVGRL
jgi:tetratricopeptide (TPR) repeat protein